MEVLLYWHYSLCIWEFYSYTLIIFFSKLVLLCITVAILCAKTAQICPIFSLERIVMTFSVWKPCPIHFLREVFWYLAGAGELHRRPSLCPIWLPLPFVRGVSVKKRDFPLLSYIPVKTLQHFGSRRELSVQLWWRGDVRGSKWSLPTNLQSGHVVLADYLFPWIWNGGRWIQLENGFKSYCSLKFPESKSLWCVKKLLPVSIVISAPPGTSCGDVPQSQSFQGRGLVRIYAGCWLRLKSFRQPKFCSLEYWQLPSKLHGKYDPHHSCWLNSANVN